jgi:hypothetical protein
MDFLEPSTSSTDSIPLNQCIYPTIVDLELPKSSNPILSESYELRPCLVEMVKSQSFSGKEDENPHIHLNEFEQTWYDRTAPSKDGDWKALCSSFCLEFFPVSKIICLHLEILSFTQGSDESLIAA